MGIGTQQKNEQGYILLYVVLAITLFVALASGVVKSTVEEVELGAQELAAVRAQSAADAALECFSYWARQPNFPFYTNTPQQSVNCNTSVGSANFNTPNGSGWCTEHTSPPYTYTAPAQLPATDSGSCADVQVEVIPRYINTIYDRPGNTPLCALRIKATGYDNCASKVVSRTRWETIGGWDPTGEAILRGTVPATTTQTDGTNRIRATVDAFAVLQIEKSGVASTIHESNAVRIIVRKTSVPLIDGEVIGYKIVNKSALNVPGLGNYSGRLVEEFDDMAGDDSLFSSFDLSGTASTTFRVSLPGDTPTGFYPLVVQAFYGAGVYDQVVVYLDVYSKGRGQE